MPTESWLIRKAISVFERHLGLGSRVKEVIDIALYSCHTRIEAITASFKFTFSTIRQGRRPRHALSSLFSDHLMRVDICKSQPCWAWSEPGQVDGKLLSFLRYVE